ncbi:hypothetical protein ACFVIM_31135 [Streptomyces sp. NPDC057638]|uniref:hypothetical protein n=1 Tax=Streptomyces sp. NPDC057638 TaxID=3346190 RepID=UPI0036A99FC7
MEGEGEEAAAVLNVRSTRLSYLCYVMAEGPVYGSGIVLPFVLCTLRTECPETALRWLWSRTRQVADRLDPDPARSPWVTSAMRAEPVPVPDAPTEIRVFCADPGEWRAAWERLERAEPVSVVIPDGPDRYTFTIAPRPLGDPP